MANEFNERHGRTRSRRANGTGSFSLVTTLPAGTTNYPDTGLQPGTVYEYHVVAVDLAGSSCSRWRTDDTAATPLATAEPSPGRRPRPTACNGAVAYNIYRGLTPGGEGASPYATVDHATSFTDAGVTGGQGYYYRITAVDFSGESTPSAEVAAAVFSARDRPSLGLAGHRKSDHLRDHLR